MEGLPTGTVTFLFAGVAATRCHYERAVRRFGAVEATRKLIGHVRGRIDQADFDQRVAAARAQLGESAFTIAWNAGQAMTLEQAIEYALADEAN